MRKVAIRMDDITEHMNWIAFKRATALFAQYGIQPLLGVVPACEDENLMGWKKQREAEAFWPYIKTLEMQGYVLAQHGLHHCYETSKGGMFPLNKSSEFAGLPLPKQRQKLKEGKECLKAHGIETSLFMAPAHSYDRHTLTALKELGFTGVTDGFGDRPYEWSGLTFYPIAFHRSGSRKKKQGVTTMVLHSNTMTDLDYMELEEVLKSGCAISYSEYLTMPVRKRGTVMRCLEYAMALFKRFMVRMRIRMRDYLHR